MKDLEVKLLNVNSGSEQRLSFLASNSQNNNGEVVIEGPDTGLHITPVIKNNKHYIAVARDNPSKGSVAVVQGEKQVSLCPGSCLYLKPRETTIIDRLHGKCRILILTPV